MKKINRKTCVFPVPDAHMYTVHTSLSCISAYNKGGGGGGGVEREREMTILLRERLID